MTLRPLVADVAGDGPAVVLLHGQPGVAANWWRVTPLLSDRWTVIVPDRLGYGRTAGPPGDFVDNARSVLDLLGRLGVESAVMVGHSWGGLVAMHLALDTPERVDGLVLVSSPAPGVAIGWTDRLLARPMVGEVTALGTFGIATRLLRVGSARRVARRWLPSETWDTIAHSAPGPGAWRTFAAEQRTYVDDIGDLALPLAHIAVPTAVVAGTADRVVGPEAAEILARQVPGALRRPVTGGGHLLPWDHPADIVAAIDELRLR